MTATLLKNTWQRYLTAIFVVELFFNQIAGINSRSATLLKRSLRRGGFFVNTLEFSALQQNFLKIFFLRQLLFDTYWGKTCGEVSL